MKNTNLTWGGGNRFKKDRECMKVSMFCSSPFALSLTFEMEREIHLSESRSLEDVVRTPC